MSPDVIKKRIQENLIVEDIILRDLTGGGDHWLVTIVSPAFEGKTLIEQHKMIMNLFTDDIASNSLHALSLKTFTPARWKALQK